jgi:hypothetical protein
MTKKHFIELADAIKDYNCEGQHDNFTPRQLYALAFFCEQQNPNFNRERWLDYIAGKCGANGGKVKS